MRKYESKRKELKQDMESIALQSPSKKRRPRGGGYKKNKTKRINQNVKNQNTIRVKRIKLKRINQNVIEERDIN